MALGADLNAPDPQVWPSLVCLPTSLPPCLPARPPLTSDGGLYGVETCWDAWEGTPRLCRLCRLCLAPLPLTPVIAPFWGMVRLFVCHVPRAVSSGLLVVGGGSCSGGAACTWPPTTARLRPSTPWSSLALSSTRLLRPSVGQVCRAQASPLRAYALAPCLCAACLQRQRCAGCLCAACLVAGVGTTLPLSAALPALFFAILLPACALSCTSHASECSACFALAYTIAY